MIELLSKEIELSERVKIRLTLSETERGKLLDVRRWERFFNWESRTLNDEFKPTKKGVAFGAKRQIVEKLINGFSAIKDALPEDDTSTEQD